MYRFLHFKLTNRRLKRRATRSGSVRALAQLRDSERAYGRYTEALVDAHDDKQLLEPERTQAYLRDGEGEPVSVSGC